MSHSVLIASDLLGGPPDMGERVYTRGIARELASRGARVVSLDGPSELAHECVVAGRMLGGGQLGRRLRRLSPRVALYPQRSSLTFGGIFRAWRLGRLAGCPVVPVVFMPAELSRGERAMARMMRPAAVASMSQEALQDAVGLWPGMAARLAPPAIDERFAPANAEHRTATRERLGWRADEKIVLHVGHLAVSRNLSALLPVASIEGVRVVVVVSSSTPADAALRQLVLDGGVTLVEGFVADIHELYGAADAYVFPTTDPNGCIGVPISVLEALACGVPVATTRFGALPQLLESSPAVAWIDGEAASDAVIEALSRGVSTKPHFRAGWAAAASSLLELAEEVG